MPLQILIHTPSWVYALFVFLAAFGIVQLRTRELGLGRVLGVALAMAGFGVWGVVSVFAAMPVSLVAALSAALATVAIVANIPLQRGTRYDTARRLFVVPGSVVPLALMMGVFFTKFGVGVALAMNPSLRADAVFALAVPALYGVFGGIFVARALRLVALMRCAPVGMRAGAAA